MGHEPKDTRNATARAFSRHALRRPGWELRSRCLGHAHSERILGRTNADAPCRGAAPDEECAEQQDDSGHVLQASILFFYSASSFIYSTQRKTVSLRILAPGGNGESLVRKEEGMRQVREVARRLLPQNAVERVRRLRRRMDAKA